MGVLIHVVLHRGSVLAQRRDVGARAPAIADLHYVMKSHGPGGNAPVYGRPHVMDGKRSSLVFEVEQEGASRGRLEPGAVVIGRVVVADRGVIPPYRNVQIVVLGVLQLHAFKIHAEIIELVGFKDDLAEKLETFREVRSDEQIYLPNGEGTREASISLALGGVVDVVVAVKGDVAESPYAQEGPVQVHSLRLGRLTLRLRVRLTWRSGLGRRLLGGLGRYFYQGCA